MKRNQLLVIGLLIVAALPVAAQGVRGQIYLPNAAAWRAILIGRGLLPKERLPEGHRGI